MTRAQPMKDALMTPCPDCIGPDGVPTGLLDGDDMFNAPCETCKGRREIEDKEKE